MCVCVWESVRARFANIVWHIFIVCLEMLQNIVTICFDWELLHNYIPLCTVSIQMWCIYINQFGVVQLFVIFFYFPSHNFPVPTLIICVFALFSVSCLPVCLSVCLCAGISLFLSVHKSGCLLCPETLRLMQRWKWFIVLSFQCVLWWFPVYFCQHENILHSCLGYFNENNHQVYPWI